MKDITDERRPFVDVLAMGVEAWDRWQSDVDSGDAVKRTKARMERRGIEQRIADMLACNPIDLARTLVLGWRALEREELLHRTESKLDHIERRIEYVERRIEYVVDRLDGMDA